MALKVQKKLYNQLVKKLENALDMILINNNDYINSYSLFGLMELDKTLPDKGDLRNCLNEYIGEQPLLSFIYDFILRDILNMQEIADYDDDFKLTQLKKYNDKSKISRCIIDSFISLPWEYCFTIKLDNDYAQIINANLEEYRINDKTRIIKPKEELINDFPYEKIDIEKGYGLLARLYSSAEWDLSNSYLQFFEKGFVDRFGTTNLIERIVSEIKAFYGIALSIKLLKIKESVGEDFNTKRVLIHKKENNEWKIERFYEMDSDVSTLINRLYLEDFGGNIKTNEAKFNYIKVNLDRIHAVFTNKQKSRKILLASQWLFDSYCGYNKLLSFVQAMITLEILLGDKKTTDKVGIGELLNNRCAYLIGKNSEEREKLLKELSEIYQIRSKIVHRGKSKLNLEEWTLFNNLREICGRVINEEISLIQKDPIR